MNLKKILIGLVCLLCITNVCFAADNKVTQIVLAENTPLEVMLNAKISSLNLAVGNIVTAQLNRNLASENILVAPKGSIITGKVVEISKSGMAMKDGKVGIIFDKMQTPDGKIVNIKTQKINAKLGGNQAANVGKMVVKGAATEATAGINIYDMKNSMKQAKTNASVGAANGLVQAVSTKGEEVTVPEGTIFNLQLIESVTVRPYLK